MTGANGPFGMRTTGFAPPRRVPLGGGLLDVADLVPPDPTGERWLQGIAYVPERCSGGHGAAFVQCAPGAVTRDVNANPASVATDPFVVWAGDRCMSLGWEGEDYVGRATRYLTVTEGSDVEEEFWGGAQAKAGEAAVPDSYSQTQYLAQAGASTLNAGSGADTVKCLSLLAQALADTAGVGRGMIHVTPRSAPYLAETGVIRRENGRWVDVMGNAIVIGSGYTGAGPDGNAPDSTHQWIYATGWVRYWRSDVELLPGSYAQAIDKATNTIEFRAQRYYLVDFDRCAHFAVLHTLNPLDLE